MAERYEFCPICFVELRVRVDDKLPWHSPRRAAVTRPTDEGPQYCLGSEHPLQRHAVQHEGKNDGT